MHGRKPAEYSAADQRAEVRVSTSNSATVRDAGIRTGPDPAVAVTLSVMGIVVLIPVLPQLMQHFQHVPDHQYLIQGGVLTMPALCIALFSPLAGWLADRLGRRRILIASMVVYGVVGIAPAFLDDLYAIIATRVAVGICEAVIMTVSTTLIGDYFSGHAREKWLASQTAVASLSSLALIGIGGVLGSLYGWRGPFLVYLFGALLAIGIWLLTWEPHADSRSGPGRSHPTARRARISLGAHHRHLHDHAVRLGHVLHDPDAEHARTLGARRERPARLGMLTAIASLGVPLGTFIYRGVARCRSVSSCASNSHSSASASCGWAARARPRCSCCAPPRIRLAAGMILPTLLVWATRGLPLPDPRARHRHLARHVRRRAVRLWTRRDLARVALGGPLAALVVLGTSAG